MTYEVSWDEHSGPGNERGDSRCPFQPELCLEREASTSAALGEPAAGKGWGPPGQARPSSGAMPWEVKPRPWSGCLTGAGGSPGAAVI